MVLTVWAQVRKQIPNLERRSTWSWWISCLWPGHCCPGLGDLVQIDLIFHTGNKTDSNITTVTAEPAAWSVSTDKVKLVEAAEMNEGGASHTQFLIVLQTLATKNKISKKATTSWPTSSLPTWEQRSSWSRDSWASWCHSLLSRLICGGSWRPSQTVPAYWYGSWPLFQKPTGNIKFHLCTL